MNIRRIDIDGDPALLAAWERLAEACDHWSDSHQNLDRDARLGLLVELVVMRLAFRVAQTRFDCAEPPADDVALCYLTAAREFAISIGTLMQSPGERPIERVRAELSVTHALDGRSQKIAEQALDRLEQLQAEMIEQ